jgi:hypothetical protein
MNIGSEDQVHADERRPEVQLAERSLMKRPVAFGIPVIDTGEEGEDRAGSHHVVEVADHVVGVVQRKVDED